MESLRFSRSPGGPFGRNLPNGRIGTTRHISQNSIEHKPTIVCLSVELLLWLIVNIGELLSIVVCHNNISRVQSIDLMSQQECPLMIRIIGNNQTLWLSFTSTLGVTLPDKLQALGCFGARSSAHIKYTVVALDVRKKRWHHRNKLLSCQQTSIFSTINYFMQSFHLNWSCSRL